MTAGLVSFACGWAWKSAVYQVRYAGRPIVVTILIALGFAALAMALFFGLDIAARGWIGGSKSITSGPLTVGLIAGSLAHVAGKPKPMMRPGA